MVSIDYFAIVEAPGESREDPGGLIRRASDGERMVYQYFSRHDTWVTDFHGLSRYFYDARLDAVKISEEEASAIIEDWTGEDPEHYMNQPPW